MDKVGRRWYLAMYPLWAFVCAIAFVALQAAEDPSRPTGRVSPESARGAALVYLRSFDDARFSAYHVIDASLYRDVHRNEKIWVVVCDSTPRSALSKAVVVDLSANDGSVIRTRRPVGVEIEEFPIP